MYVQDIRTCQGSREELDELSRKGRIKINSIQTCIDKFKQLAELETNLSLKNTLQFEVKSFADEHLTTIAEFKRATVSCMLSLDVKARQELLTTNDESLLNHR